MSNISTRAMLINLSITSWTARKHDKKITSEVAANHNTSESAGRYNKNLLPMDSATYKAVTQAANAARTAHYEQTLPWSDEGSRILPAANYIEYSTRLQRLHNEFDNAVAAFIADYPTLQNNAQRLLNGLYNAEDYPSVAELRSKFSFSTKVLPLPDANDFRVSLDEDDVQAIRSEIERNVQDSINAAQGDLYERLFSAVSRMVDRLSDDKAIFRDSLVINLRELCDIIPRLNLTGDANLEALRVRIEKSLASFEPDDLRDDKALRASVAKMASKVQADMAAMMGIK